jgi:amino acid adenylation domain-containing protein
MSDFAARVAALSPEHRALLELQIKRKNLEQAIELGIPKRPESQDIPLSPAQERLWLLHQLEPNQPTYNESLSFRLRGTLQVDLLKRSILQIIERHEILRTSIQVHQGQPIQVVHPDPQLDLSVVNIQDIAPPKQEHKVQSLMTATSSLPFDLTQAPLMRGLLIQLAPQDHVMLLTAHHLISDGWSWRVFFKELTAIYTALTTDSLPALEPLPIQYGDVALWQRQQLQKPEIKQQLVYWQEQLANIPPLLELPTDFPRPPIQTFKGARQFLTLPGDLSQSLKHLSKTYQVSLFSLLLSAFQVLLYRYTDNPDILVGAPVANRRQRQTEDLFGCFINTLVLRADLGDNPKFSDLLTQVQQTVSTAQDNQDLPFEQLVQALQPERSLSHSPLFQVLFVFQDQPLETLALPQLTVEPMLVDSGVAKFDLTLYLDNRPDGLATIIEYNADLFEATTIEHWLSHWQILLRSIVAQPDRAINDLDILRVSEQQQIAAWNQTEVPYPSQYTVHQWVEQQVARTPDAIALQGQGQTLTYRELDDRANHLANYLRHLGVKTETLVAVCLERSLEMIVGLLAILKAGGAYVPLDPNYPADRLTIILEDTQSPVLLTQQRLVETLPEHQATVVCLDQDWSIIVAQSQEIMAQQIMAQPPTSAPAPVTITSQNLAYVIYTSGSTGRPKGVAIEHRSTGALIHWAQQTFSAQALSRVLASTSICFDLSVFEIFVPLSVGGTVWVVDNILELPQLGDTSGIRLINTVPSAIAELLRIGGIPRSVEIVNIAGEPLAKTLVDQLYDLGTVQQVYNLYGPSEDTTYSTVACLSPGDSRAPSIGHPINNTQAHLLDSNYNPVPIGVIGELYLSGSGLARGYLHRPELTAERFIQLPDPTHLGMTSPPTGSSPRPKQLPQRLYKTGDRARYRRDGNIEYLGRIDHQVKLRGFRIELGEIESVLSSHPQVDRTVVIFQTQETVNGPHQRLVAYVMPKDLNPTPEATHEGQNIALRAEANPQGAALESELKSLLETKLPGYMVPGTFVILKAFPLTPNGKIDRKSLPTPDLTSASPATVKPQTALEQQIAQIWQGVLPDPSQGVGIDDNFFHLGGHSLLLLRVQTQLNQELGQDLPFVTLFQYPTIRSLAQYLSQTNTGPTASEQGLERAAQRRAKRNTRQRRGVSP